MERPAARAHFVQLYEADDAALVSNVVAYLGEGLRRGQRALAVVTKPHEAAISQELQRSGCDVARAVADGRLTLLHTDEALARFMGDRHPDAARFEGSLGNMIRDAVTAEGATGVRVYGEMVGVLWAAKQYPAAIRLEQLWHHLQQKLDFSLFCGYPIDVFGKHFDGGIINALLCAHTHLLPTVSNPHLERALNRAMEDLLGLTPKELRASVGTVLVDAWGVVPNAEATILWLRRTHPRYADTILETAKTYYSAAVRRSGLHAIYLDS